MSNNYQQNVLKATREEVISDLSRSIYELEEMSADMDKIEFGDDITPSEGILISGNEAKRIVQLLKEKL